MLSEREFGRRLHAFRNTLSASMRQVHKAGEKLFVDFSGKRIGYRTDEGRKVHGHANPRIKPRSNAPFYWLNAGFWRRYAIAPSIRWTR